MPLSAPPVTTSAEVRELSEPQCRELLTAETVGRVGYVSAAGVQIIPLSYRFADDVLYIRTRPDSQLDQLADADRPVTFEVDYHGADFVFAWSVLMQGHLERLDPAGRRLMAALHLPVIPWPADCTRGLRFVSRSFTGRTISPARP